jgi:hypothetical protein
MSGDDHDNEKKEEEGGASIHLSTCLEIVDINTVKTQEPATESTSYGKLSSSKLIQAVSAVEDDSDLRPINHVTLPLAVDRHITILLRVLVACFICMLVTLEILKRHSDLNMGLAFVDLDWHYLWTYGPTFGKCSRVEDVAVERSQLTKLVST